MVALTALAVTAPTIGPAAAADLASISGVIVDSRGAPVPGISVTAYSLSWDQYRGASSDTDGSFVIDELVTDEGFVLNVEEYGNDATRYQRGFVTGDAAHPATYDVPEAQVFEAGSGPVTVVLGDALLYSGVVTDEAGQGLPGVQVTLQPEDPSPAQQGWATTGPDGAFVAGGLTPGGVYRVQAWVRDSPQAYLSGYVQADGHPGDYGTATKVTLTADSPDHRIVLPDAIFFRGVIVDGDGAPVEGVSLDIDQRSGIFGTTAASDADGSFVAGGLAPGAQYTIHAWDSQERYASGYVAAGAHPLVVDQANAASFQASDDLDGLRVVMVEPWQGSDDGGDPVIEPTPTPTQTPDPFAVSLEGGWGCALDGLGEIGWSPEAQGAGAEGVTVRDASGTALPVTESSWGLQVVGIPDGTYALELDLAEGYHPSGDGWTQQAEGNVWTMPLTFEGCGTAVDPEPEPEQPLSSTPDPVLPAAVVGVPTAPDTGTWAPEGVELTFQWLRDGISIPGAVSGTYTPEPGDVGAMLAVAVTGSKPGYTSVTRQSAAVMVRPGAAPAVLALPALSGTSKVGSTLTATAGSWSLPGVNAAFQWLRDGAAISGATSSTYRLVATDYGRSVAVRVTTALDGYEPATATSTSVNVAAGAAPVATVKPSVTGSPAVGSTLTAKPGTWSLAGVALTYQWLRAGASISGATGSTYKVTTADYGKSLSVKVTAKATGYASGTATSAAVTGAAGPAATATVKPTVSGTGVVGSTLTAKPGTWSLAGVALTYQWLRDGAVISGATATTYKVATADVGKKVSVRVTAKKAAYSTGTATSATVVGLRALTATPTPKISGTAKVAVKLTAVPGTWSPATVTLRYQWLRDGVAISGATASTYTPTASDGGHRLSVRVTGSRTGYGSVVRTSASTAAVVAGAPAVVRTKPAVTGTVKVGSVLTATPGTWSLGGLTFSYQWLRDGASISGQTAQTYKPVLADAGHKLSVKVTARRSWFGTASATSAAVAVPLLVQSGGSVKVQNSWAADRKITTGTKVKAVVVAPTGARLAKTEWIVGGKVVSTASTYLLTQRVSVTVRVTFTRTGYSPRALSVTFTPPSAPWGPLYDTVGEFRAAGYGPYYAGTTEYARYRDSDGDRMVGE